MGLSHLFGRGHFLDLEDEVWHLQVWRWMLANCGGIERLKRSPVVQASREFFPPTEETGHARAEHIFACVKKHARMSNWRCELIAQPESIPLQVGGLATLKHISGSPPLGTFKVDEAGEVIITYDPAKIAEPATLVATLAHELAHYRIATIHEDLPGGHDMHEYATDLMTVFLGFGLFGANGAFNFSQFQSPLSQGWQWSRAGYLRERDWAFALAVFLDLREEPKKTLRPFLKAHLYSDMRAAAKRLAREPSLLDEHRRIQHGDKGP